VGIEPVVAGGDAQPRSKIKDKSCNKNRRMQLAKIKVEGRAAKNRSW